MLAVGEEGILYHGSIQKSVIKIGIRLQQLGAEESGIGDVLEHGHLDWIVFEMREREGAHEGHGCDLCRPTWAIFACLSALEIALLVGSGLAEILSLVCFLFVSFFFCLFFFRLGP